MTFADVLKLLIAEPPTPGSLEEAILAEDATQPEVEVGVDDELDTTPVRTVEAELTDELDYDPFEILNLDLMI